MMETFDIQVLLKDGSFADYEVQNEKDNYNIVKEKEHLISFKANEDGTWSVLENAGDIDEDLQERIINQLNGFRI